MFSLNGKNHRNGSSSEEVGLDLAQLEFTLSDGRNVRSEITPKEIVSIPPLSALAIGGHYGSAGNGYGASLCIVTFLNDQEALFQAQQLLTVGEFKQQSNGGTLPVSWGKTVTALKTLPCGRPNSNKAIGSLVIAGDSLGHLTLLYVPEIDMLARNISFTPKASGQIVDIYPKSLLNGLVLTDSGEFKSYSFDLNPQQSTLKDFGVSIPGTFTASGYTNHNYRICTVEDKKEGTFTIHRYSIEGPLDSSKLDGQFHSAFVLADEIVVLHRLPIPYLSVWPHHSDSISISVCLNGDKFSDYPGSAIRESPNNSKSNEAVLFATDQVTYKFKGGNSRFLAEIGTPLPGRIVPITENKLAILDGSVLRPYSLD